MFRRVNLTIGFAASIWSPSASAADIDWSVAKDSYVDGLSDAHAGYSLNQKAKCLILWRLYIDLLDEGYIPLDNDEFWLRTLPNKLVHQNYLYWALETKDKVNEEVLSGVGEPALAGLRRAMEGDRDELRRYFFDLGTCRVRMGGVD